MILSVHQPQYIPWLGYFDKIAKSGHFVFLDCVQYKEREFQNRNKVRTDKGAIWLTVPVESKGMGRQRIDQVRVDNSVDWRRKHWDTLKACYGRAAHFREYSAFFEDTYSRQWHTLMALNVHIIEYLLKSLSINTPISFESALKTSTSSTDRIIEICRKLGADTYLSGSGGKDYLEEEKFQAAGIRLEYQHFVHPVYHQQFMRDEHDFLPYMSALDLIFNEGPNSRRFYEYPGDRASS